MEDLRDTFLTLDTSLSNAIPYLINCSLPLQQLSLCKYLLFLSSPLPEPEQEEAAVSRLRAKKEIMWVQSELQSTTYALLSLYKQRRRSDRQEDSAGGQEEPHATQLPSNCQSKSVSVSLSYQKPKQANKP